ncbi:MAG TPA: class I SAM-dependent methyltransferase, partial [Acidimicrobiia bacterium]|nr:class I SAM-dependent methyltransferase [Acidimicrobiia bacterium]
MDRAAWNERYREKELLWTAQPNRFLVEVVADLVPGAAYDLAGGEGRNAVWLAERGWRVTVVDWSAVALEKGRRLAEQRGVEVRFEEADLLDWSPLEHRDLVAVVYLHLPPRERHAAWRTALEATVSGGTVVIIGHDSSNLTEGCGGPQSPEVLYTADEVVEVIGERVEVVRAERVTRPVEL